MIRYLILTHPHLDGVGLSKPGHWGGIRFSSDEAAAKAAEVDAKGQPFRIERETVKKFHALKI